MASARAAPQWRPSSDGRAGLSSTGASDAPTPPSESNPAVSPQAAGGGPSVSQRMNCDRARLTHALLLSLLIHILLMSLTFGNLGWLPGFGFPWQVATFAAPDLRAVLVPPDTVVHSAVTRLAESSQQGWAEQPVAGGPVPTPSESRAPTPGPFKAAIVPAVSPSADAEPSTEVKPSTEAKPSTAAKPRTLGKPRTEVKPRTKQSRADVASGAATAKGPLHVGPGDAALPAHSPAGCDRLGAERRAHVESASCSNSANLRHRGSAKHLEPGDRDAVGSRCKRCGPGGN